MLGRVPRHLRCLNVGDVRHGEMARASDSIVTTEIVIIKRRARYWHAFFIKV
ncbi:hypothetical protein [uncultured Methanobrevibacter sp.]|uniref:hypothetical protein n=1 Tax=uncultured Methanobrevibacter sp. TaxID=253161 RepID=UPI00262A7861|nr:hypothetical protein [uncultured Methanobrevibacter sp.]